MIYDDREQRDAIQQQMLQHHQSVVVLRANYPGVQKRNPYASMAVLTAYDALTTECHWTERRLLYTAEGLVLLLGAQTDALALKRKTTDFEENHPLGRLVDCDVMHEAGEISRSALQLPPRRCFICNQRAVFCVRNQTHALEDIEDFFQRRVLKYIEEDTFVRSLFFAITCELSRPYSYGCVSFASSGIHKDMDAWTYIESTRALLRCIHALPKEPLAFSKLRAYGRRCEEILDAATGGVNAQKGLLFFTLLVAEAYKQTTETAQMPAWMKQFSQPLLADFTQEQTKHLKAIDALGARGHALNGMALLFEEALPLFESTKNVDAVTRFWIAHTDDTTAIRRVGMDLWRKIQEETRQGIPSEALNTMIESSGASTGGIADLSTCTLLIAGLRKENGNEHTEKSCLRNIKLQ